MHILGQNSTLYNLHFIHVKQKQDINVIKMLILSLLEQRQWWPSLIPQMYIFFLQMYFFPPVSLYKKVRVQAAVFTENKTTLALLSERLFKPAPKMLKPLFQVLKRLTSTVSQMPGNKECPWHIRQERKPNLVKPQGMSRSLKQVVPFLPPLKKEKKKHESKLLLKARTHGPGQEQ